MSKTGCDVCKTKDKKSGKSKKNNKSNDYECHFNYPGEFNEWITLYVLDGCGYSEKALKLLEDLDNFCDGFLECACYQIYRSGTTEAKAIPEYQKENVVKKLNNLDKQKLSVTFSKDQQQKIKQHKTFPFVFIRDLKNGKFKGSNKMQLYDSTEFEEWLYEYKSMLKRH